MRTTNRGIGRTLPLLALLALAPLALSGCESSGEGGGLPTGPTTQYIPGMDTSGATITVRAEPATGITPGGTFKLAVTFVDATGRPVAGVPLVAHAENAATLALDPASGYFAFATNPTVTGDNGGASILVGVSSTCPTDSFMIRVRTFPAEPVSGPSAEGHVMIGVNGRAVTSLTLVTTTPTVTLSQDATFLVSGTTTLNCTSPVVQYNAQGAGLATGWTNVPAADFPMFSVTPTSVGTLTVLARGRCGSSGYVFSDAVTVSVTL